MRKNIIEILILSMLLTGFIFGFDTSAITEKSEILCTLQDSGISNSFDGYTDITADEAWNLVSDTANGIQIPIDVRTDPEWINEHIDAPSPEHARHHCKCEWENEAILQEFISLYEGKEIILYCKSGGRSTSAANTLIENDFDGTIYNMIGGITYWKNNGYPTVGNRPPETPQINGPNNGEPGQDYNFTITTNDPDNDIVYYYINWDDGESEIYETAYNSGEEIIFTHSWESRGIYNIEIKARDTYFEESEWESFEITISSTDLEIIDVQGGFGAITVDIKNIGDYTAENVSSTISVNGGLLSGINLTHTCSGCSECENTLEPGAIKTESTRGAGLIFGLGPIEITISTEAKNAEEVSVTENGFVIGPYISIG